MGMINNTGNLVEVKEYWGDGVRECGSEFRVAGSGFLDKLCRGGEGEKEGCISGSNVGLVKEFAIKEGRSGDFIEDRNGKKIPLTALIFGRHHKAGEKL